EYEIARIEPVLDRDLANRTGHDHGRDRQDAVGHLDEAFGAAIAQGCGDLLLDGAACAAAVERELAAEKTCGVEPAEHGFGVGHRRLGAAAAVPPRPRRRAGALRPDMESLLRIEPGDRAAARADLDDVDHR